LGLRRVPTFANGCYMTAPTPTRGATKFDKFIEKRRISQETVAEALGVTSAAIYGWRKGIRKPRTAYRNAIAIWTSGAVPVASWGDDAERYVVSHVKPYSKSA